MTPAVGAIALRFEAPTHAEIASRISTLQAAVGRAADPRQTQLSILPHDSALQAELFVPAQAIGFVRSGQEVRVLYNAFPYQRFGTYSGRVVGVARTMLTGNDVSAPVSLQQPAYKVIVRLDRQDVTAYGKQILLQPDMLLKAYILLDRRSLLVWLLDPLLSREDLVMLQSLMNFGSRRRLPLMLQTEATECGLACLAMVAGYHRHRVDLNTLRRRHPVSLKGVTLKSMMLLAGHLKLACRPLRFDLHHLRDLRLPAIVHWDMNHFVVLKSVSAKAIVVHDPAFGERRYPLAEASKHLTGVALELTPAAGFAPRDEAVRLPLSAFWGQLTSGGPALAQVFVLSLILQVLVIASPFYMQIAVDEVITKGDVDLLLVLALGFGGLAAISAASTALRSYILLILQNTLSLEMAARLFRHLVRLPLAYFEKRHIGDILSRFAATEPIRTLLAEGLIGTIIDGVMAIATLVMIFIYSAKLAAVVFVAVALYAALRIGLYRLLRRQNEELIRAKAQDQSTFIEAVRAIQSLKLFNRESESEGHWLNRYADTVNANVRLGRLNIGFKTLNEVLFGVENIVTIYLGARLALDGGLTVGMLFAFTSYKRYFIDKGVQLVEKALDFRILDLHLERLADIALSPPEPGYDRPPLAYERPIEGRIELRNVDFRYAETEPFILKNVHLTVEPGEFVVIAGPSGAGKTTLAKVMLGLLEPTAGEVVIDGTPLSLFGAQAYREHVAAVMQDDHLISGSIADNICFFDPAFEMSG